MADPEPVVTKLSADYVEIRCERSYRGKTNGYWKETRTIQRLVDSGGSEVAIPQPVEWTEIAPGIEARFHPDGESFRIGSHRHDHHWDLCVRIHRDACPVQVQYLDTSEYIDYGDSSFSSSNMFVRWVRYEV